LLVVDLDPQANATSCLGVDKRTVQESTYDALLNGDVPASSILFNERLQLSLLPPRRRWRVQRSSWSRSRAANFRLRTPSPRWMANMITS